MTPPLGIAHFTTLDVAPLPFVEMAAKIGYAAVGLRLHPAFPGSPFYEIAAGGTLMRAMRAALGDTGLAVHDIEFVVIDAAFEPEPLKPMLDSAAELGARRLASAATIPITRLRKIRRVQSRGGGRDGRRYRACRGRSPAAATADWCARRPANGACWSRPQRVCGRRPADLRAVPRQAIAASSSADAPADARPTRPEGS
jgi:hypothetical protein